MKPLNPSQKLAVDYDQGHLLIVAGPGTGKTHTLTHRIMHFLNSLEEDQRILAITFTNKAADEMRERVQKMGDGDPGRVFIGTFHQFCLQLLRKYIDKTSLPREFVVAVPEEIEGLVKAERPGFEPENRRTILEEISQWKSSEFDTEPSPNVTRYDAAMRAKGWLSFDDILLETYRLLGHNEDLLGQIRSTYRFIFVDEYQDINRIQNVLLKQLVGLENSITAIGDPNQAIYGFRGSSKEYFESFAEDFSGAKVLSLSDNYRSAKNLLSASSQIMANSGSVYVPELTAQIYAQGRLTIHDAPTDKAEAEYVVHQIERIVGGTTMFSQDSGRVASEEEGTHSFGDIAVLYRLNSQRFGLKKAFERMGIPFAVSGENKRKNEDILGDVYFADTREPHLEAEKVSLMTLHSAKGLEFPVVFIVGCEEHLLPLDLDGMTSDTEEERRLFYVGMTRAKERLYLVRAQKRLLYGKTYHNDASRFLFDIEEELKIYEKKQPKKRTKNEEQLSLF